MATLEMIDFRLNDFEKTTQSFDRTLSQIQVNQEKLFKRSENIFKRVELIEKELDDGKLKGNIFKILRESYPLVLIVLFFMTSVDHKKMVEVVSEINSIHNIQPLH